MGAGEPGRGRTNWGGGVWRGWDDTGVARGGAGRRLGGPHKWGAGRGGGGENPTEGAGRWGSGGRDGGEDRGEATEERGGEGLGGVGLGGTGGGGGYFCVMGKW